MDFQKVLPSGMNTFHTCGNEHMHCVNMCVCVCVCACCCVRVFVWDHEAEAKVKSALARLSGWMEDIRVSRDCSGICRRI